MARFILLSCYILLNVTARGENILPTLDSLLHLAKDQLEAVTYPEAQANALEALRLYQAESAENSSILATCYHLLGNIALEQSMLKEALSYFEQAKASSLALKGETRLALAKAYNDLGNYFMEIRDYQAAHEQYNMALDIRKKWHKTAHTDLADSYSNIGNYHLAVGNYSVATAEYTKGLRIREKVLSVDHRDLASSYYSLADAYFYQNNFSTSFKYLNKALQLRKGVLAEEHPVIGKSLLQLGRHHQVQGNLAAATEAYFAAANIFRRWPERKKDLANWHTRMGNSLEEEGRYAKALLQYDSAFQLRQSLFETHSSVGESLNDMGNCYASMGDFGNALYAYQSALSVIEQSPYQDQLYLAALYENLGISTRHRRRLEESLIYLEKALAIKSTTLGEKAPELGTTLINLGNAYIDLQDYQQAEAYYQSALAIAQQAYGEGHLSTLLPINNLGIFFFNQQKFKPALYYFQLAYKTAQQIYSANSPALAIYTKNISLTHSRLNAHQEALSMAEKGLSLLGEGGAEVGAPTTYLALLQVKAKSRFALASNEGALLAAYRTFKKATDYLDATRLLYEDEFSRQNLVTSNFEIYEGALQCLFALIESGAEGEDWQEEAFYHFEKSKSLSLLDALLRSKALNFNDLPPELKAKEDVILAKINYWEKKRYDWLNTAADQENKDSIIVLNQEVAHWKGEHRVLMEEVREENARYYQLKYNQQVSSSEMVRQELLKGDKALLEYFIGQDHIYIFLLSPTEKKLLKVPFDFPLERWIANLREAISAFPVSGTESANIYLEVFTSFSHQLYQKIFEPLTGLALPSKLIIVPDGALSYLPFELLLSQAPEDLNQFKSYPYLIKNYQLSYAFSATFLHQIIADERHAPVKPFLGVAPTFAPDGPFAPLEFNQKEVDRIGALLRGASIHRQATVAEFKAMAADYNILHLATHGVLNDKADAFSYIALTPDSSLQDQGVLFTRDLYDMRLNAAMVVLSACETGLGKYQKGEGIISLARGFAYAGAKSTLTTLWSIDDETTTELMYQFYLNLKENLPKDEALHQAKIQFLEEQANIKAHPFYWAPFILIGDTAPIAGGGYGWWMAGGILLLIMLGFLAWRFIRK